MAKKHDLPEWLYDSLDALGGKATIVEACKHVWKNHEQDLRRSGDLFYTWQYDIRWAATLLRRSGQMKPKELSPKGIWELA